MSTKKKKEKVYLFKHGFEHGLQFHKKIDKHITLGNNQPMQPSSVKE